MSTLSGKVGKSLSLLTDTQLEMLLSSGRVPTEAIEGAIRDVDPRQYHIIRKHYQELPAVDYSLNELLLDAAIREDFGEVDQLIELGAADINTTLIELAVRPGSSVRMIRHLLEVENGGPLSRSGCLHCRLMAVLARDSDHLQLLDWLASMQIVPPDTTLIQRIETVLSQSVRPQALLYILQGYLRDMLPLLVINRRLAAQILELIPPEIINVPDYLQPYPEIVIDMFIHELDVDNDLADLAVKYEHQQLIDQLLVDHQREVALAAAKYGKLELLFSIERQDYKSLRIAALSNGRLLTADMLKVPLTREDYARILITAAVHGHLNVVRLLAQAHSSTEALAPSANRSAYLVAWQDPRLANMRLVVRYLEALIQPVEDESAFLQAVMDGQTQLIQLYFTQPQLPFAVELAATSGNLDSMTALIKRILLIPVRLGMLATLTTSLNQGLAIAAEHGRLPLVDLLINNGANVGAAIEIAAGNGWTNAVTILSITREAPQPTGDNGP